MGEVLQDRFKNYMQNSENAKKWFENNFENIKSIFENIRVRNFIFEPFKDVFTIPDNIVERDIYTIITQVAIINAILAGLPGQMGVGVYVSMSLEAWMAYAIAQHIGIKVENPSDIFKYFGLLSTVGFTILFGFKHLLSFGFSLFSVIPGINPLIIAELLVTDLVGVLFWIGFMEVSKNDSFSIPKRMLISIGSKVKEIFSFQFKALKAVLTIDNIKLFANRLKLWLTGDFLADTKTINGELFAATAMSYLIAGEFDKLNGPLGEVFEEAIRLRWSAQFNENTTIEEIAERFNEYSPEALHGAISTIKGKMFEIMVANAENMDNDAWKAYMHEDESFPGSDIVFTNSETGEQLEVSLKATGAEDTTIIEHALNKYPDLPIMTTDEAAEIYGDNPQVFGSGVSHEELQNITEERMDELINSIQSVDATHVAIGGVVFGTLTAAWPFTIAYLRNKISFESYQNAMVKILGKSGAQLAIRISYAVLLGPIFAWYLLARSINITLDHTLEKQPSKKIAVIY